MKKYLLILLVFISCFVGNGLTIKEKIQEDLSKMGMKQEIIDETIRLKIDRASKIDPFEIKFPDEYTEEKENFETLYKKDTKNYIVLEELISIYNEIGSSEEYKLKKYISEYKKANISEERKNFFLGREYWKNNKNETPLKTEYFEKVKNNSKNEYYLRTIDFLEYISNELNSYYIGDITELWEKERIKNLKIVDKAIEKMDLINEILDSQVLREKFGISDEEAYSDKLDNFAEVQLYRGLFGNNEGLKQDFLNKIANQKIPQNVEKYNQLKEDFVFSLSIQWMKEFEKIENSRNKINNIENYKKFLKSVKNTEIYKRKKDNKELMLIMYLMFQD